MECWLGGSIEFLFTHLLTISHCSFAVTEQNHDDVCQAEDTDCARTKCSRCQHIHNTGTESLIFSIVLYTWRGARGRVINSALNSGCFCEIHASSRHSKLQWGAQMERTLHSRGCTNVRSYMYRDSTNCKMIDKLSITYQHMHK
jgi:hypothetical protein